MVNSDLTPSASHDPKDLVGTWKLVSVLTEQDGRKSGDLRRRRHG
jgi:hypothetical protein